MSNGSEHDRMSLADVARRTAVVVLVLFGLFALAMLVYYLRRILVWVLIATMLALALEPAVNWLERRHLPRWLAASLATLVAALILLGAVVGAAIPLVSQLHQLIGNLPHYVRDLFKPGSPLAFIDTRFHVVHRIRSISSSDVLRVLGGSHGSAVQVFTRTISFVAATVTVVVIMLMLLVEGPRAWKAFIESLGGPRGAHIDTLGRRMQQAVAGYIRGNLLISLFATAGSYVAMLAIGVAYPLPLAIIVGVLDIIPLIGATLGAAVCVIVALNAGWLPAVILLAYFVIYQQIENHFIMPVVYSRSVAMSPLAVLLVSLAGAVLGGLIGVLVAIPLASALMIVVGDLLRTHGVDDLATLAGAMSKEGPTPLSKDDAEEVPHLPPDTGAQAEPQGEAGADELQGEAEAGAEGDGPRRRRRARAPGSRGGAA